MNERASRWLRARPRLAALLRPLLLPLVHRHQQRQLRLERPAADAPGLWQRGLVWPARRLLGRMGLRVTPADVRWCYREMLGREPESEAALMAHCRHRDFQSLADRIVRSPEYLARMQEATPGSGRSALAPISAADFRRSIEVYLAARPASAELQAYVDVHFDRLLHTLNVLQRQLPHGARMIDFSAAGFFAHAVRQLVGDVVQTSVTGVNFELDDYAGRFGEDAFDLCVNTEVLEHLLYDPAHMVASINRMLRSGGLLFLTTPNATSMANCIKLLDGNAPGLWTQFKPGHPYYERHNREWAPGEVERLLREHGFEVLALYTRDFYASSQALLGGNGRRLRWVRENAAHEHFGDTVCVLARKARPCAAVRSEWLYA